MDHIDRSGSLEPVPSRGGGHAARHLPVFPPPLRWTGDTASLFPFAIRRCYGKGEWITGGAALYVVLEGRVGLLMQDSEGRQALLVASGCEGVIAGDEMRGCDHAVRLLAESRTVILHVCARDLTSALASNRCAAAFVVGALTARLVDANAKLASLAFQDVRARVVDTLLELARVRDGAWVVDCGSGEIARRVAASREMVSRVLGCMVGEGVVRRHKRKTVILDRDALVRVGGERRGHL